MFWKKKPTPQPEPPIKRSIFSTDLDLGNTKFEQQKNLNEQLAKSFQRPISDIRALGGQQANVGMDSMQIAMDQSQVAIASNVPIQAALPNTLLGWFAGQGFISWQ